MDLKRRNIPVIFCTMTDHDESRIVYVQAFENLKPIQEQIEMLLDWYTPKGLVEICESEASIADITSKKNNQGSCGLSPYDYYDIRTGRAVKPEHEGPAWVMWAADDGHDKNMYLETLDRRITIASLFADRGIQSAFICETKVAADQLKARLSTI